MFNKSNDLITASIIESSVNESGQLLTTFLVEMPKWMTPEFLTYRTFSRNAGSSRAKPTNFLLDMVKKTPFVPVVWGANQKGMQATKEISNEEQDQARELWLKARDNVVSIVEAASTLNIHKQTLNRLLEAFVTVPYIVTACSFEQLYKQRFHKDAQPEFVDLAGKMLAAFYTTKPTVRKNHPFSIDSWHLPFVTQEERETLTVQQAIKSSIARCARVSYFTHGTSSIDHEKDNALYESLVKEGNDHWSPTEHVAHAAPYEMSGNFYGWKQYRKFFPQESHSFTYEDYVDQCKKLGIEPVQKVW